MVPFVVFALTAQVRLNGTVLRFNGTVLRFNGTVSRFNGTICHVCPHSTGACAARVPSAVFALCVRLLCSHVYRAFAHMVGMTVLLQYGFHGGVDDIH